MNKIIIINEKGLGLEQPNIEDHNISVYPNPTNDRIHISMSDLNGEQGTIEIYSILGEKLQTYQLDNEQLDISIGNLPGTVYILQVKTSRVYSFKLIKL